MEGQVCRKGEDEAGETGAGAQVNGASAYGLRGYQGASWRQIGNMAFQSSGSSRGAMRLTVRFQRSKQGGEPLECRDVSRETSFGLKLSST